MSCTISNVSGSAWASLLLSAQTMITPSGHPIGEKTDQSESSIMSRDLLPANQRVVFDSGEDAQLLANLNGLGPHFSLI